MVIIASDVAHDGMHSVSHERIENTKMAYDSLLNHSKSINAKVCLGQIPH